MHTCRNTLGALAAVSALVAGNAMAEIEYELHTGYSNEYLFRGLNLGQDLIEVGADVKADVSGVGLSAGVWYGSFDNADLGDVRDLTVDELDLYGQVSKNFGLLTGAIGYIYRYYDAHDDASLGTQEVYFSVSRQICGIDTSLTYFWGVEDDNDGYAEFALGRSFELSPCLAFNCGAKLGYLAEQGQLSALTSKLSLDWGFTTTATLSPFVAWSLALSDDNDTAYSDSKNQVVGGVMLSVAF
jgi:hypothetical protein